MNIVQHKSSFIQSDLEEVILSSKNEKEYRLQYVPSKLLDIKYEKFKYKEVLLNKYVLYTLINNIIFTYYRERYNNVVLNAEVLKMKIGRNYNKYVEYLIENNIIEKVKNHLAGSISRTYKICDSIISNKEIKRVKNYNISYLFDSKFVTQSSESNLIKESVKDRLIKDLFKIDLDSYRASIDLILDIDFSDVAIAKDVLSGYDLYNWNLGNIDKILNKEIYYKIDDYGRFHSNFTNLKSEVRKNALSINGRPIYEFDIPNSQPTFLLLCIKKHMAKYEVDKNEYDEFKDLVISATLYDVLGDMWGIKSKRKVKKQLFAILYGEMKYANRNKQLYKFREKFPTIYNFMVLYKKANTYKVIAHELQRMESDMIYNHILDYIYEEFPDIIVFTVHDCIAIPIDYVEKVKPIFEYYMDKLKRSL